MRHGPVIPSNKELAAYLRESECHPAHRLAAAERLEELDRRLDREDRGWVDKHSPGIVCGDKWSNSTCDRHFGHDRFEGHSDKKTGGIW